nr:DNA-binding protein [Geodermatophilaceae bacterium]
MDARSFAMNRRVFLLTGLGAAGAVALGACTGDDAPSPGPDDAAAASRPTLRLGGISGDWGLPSPFTYQALPGYLRMNLIYDSLLWADASGELLPWLASSFERSADGLTYTFQLREDVSWHDGMPFSAEDVK